MLQKSITDLYLLKIFALVVGLCLNVVVQADHGIDAYVFQAGVSDNQLPEHALKGQGHLVKPNPVAMQYNHITFQLPGGQALVAERKRMVTDAHGQSWVGKFQGALGGTVILSHRNGIVSGIIDDGENLYELMPGHSGQTLLFQVDESSLPPLATPLVSSDLDSSGGSTSSETTAASGTIQDLMLVYTPAVNSSYGSTAATESALLNAVVATNQAYLDSLVDIQLNVVHIAELAYSETGDMGLTLSRLRQKSDGYMDEVHGVRENYGADLVAMISMDTNYCGIAYLMTNDSTSFEYLAFSVTKKSCLSGSTLDHELGHNQGNCHNREETGCTNPAYAYGYGLCGPTFRTIMSYSSPCGTSRIRHFSNPDVLVGGYPTGIDHDIDPANSADSARTMNNTAATVAAFRLGATSIPLDPSNLTASAQSDSRIDLQWSDNSGDESGFELERSLDGSDWSPLATLGANATNYADTGLDPNTLYFYRLRAFNSVGSSGWSNSDNDQTFPPPPPPMAPESFEATAMSGERIDLVWTNVDNEDGYHIYRSIDGSLYNQVASPAADSTTYSDTGLTLDTEYFYQVYAFNNGGVSPEASTSATTLSYTDHKAVGESNTYGNVSGSYVDTWSDNDNGIESITETETGGKPSRRYSRAKHRWQFSLSAGNSALLVANAWKSGSDEDDFSFEYSTDGSNYSPAFVVSSRLSSNEQMALLPSGTSGTFYVRVTDTDQNQGNRNFDTINVNHLYVRVEGGNVGSPPIAPTDLTATATTGQIDLVWTDMPVDEVGFEIERSMDGNNWLPIASTGADIESYTDKGLIGGTTYYYQIRSYNAAGYSAWDGPAWDLTPLGLTLVANGSKVKGSKQVALSWTGGSSEQLFGVYRDGELIYTTASGATGYTDQLNSRGGGTYVYKVCADTGNCSNDVTVVF